jgi:hypothetical protein
MKLSAMELSMMSTSDAESMMELSRREPSMPGPLSVAASPASLGSTAWPPQPQQARARVIMIVGKHGMINPLG